jgi:chitinase
MHDYRVIGYYAAWTVYRDFEVSAIPAAQLTHINYAFANISEDGDIVLGDPWADVEMPDPNDKSGAEIQGNFRQLQLLKAAYPHLKTLISVGGWSWSERFSDVALTAESRARFARSAVDFITRYGFDGVDLDWEYPTGSGDPGNVERPQDPENFILLLAELRAQLDARGATDGRPYLLTIAAGAGRTAYAPLDWPRIHPLLDWINVMTYDMSGPWSSVTGFNAPLYDSQPQPPEGTSADTTLRDFVALGVPADKLVLGVPFYGRGWANAGPTNDGLHQPFSGLPAGTREQGAYDYADLAANYIRDGVRHWHDAAQVPWLYDPATGVMISYDDPQSLTTKAAYVRAQGLGGIMIWELSTDDGTLLTAIDAALSAP